MLMRRHHRSPYAEPIDPHDQHVELPNGDPPSIGPVPENIVAGAIGQVDADFDSGGDDGYDASDFGPIADNIVVGDE
jgi:hypothetical protein